MIILTAANKDIIKDGLGGEYRNFSFRDVITATAENSRRFGYVPVIYDLGQLGIGKLYYEEDETFQKEGYYRKIQHGYQSKSLFKPDIIEKCLKEYNDFIVYLDGDALLYKRIDEVHEASYDIGVTLRSRFEMESQWYKDHKEIVKYVNAGVIFFNPTPRTFQFIEMWKKRTGEVGNDQQALNELVCSDEYPGVNSIAELNGIKIKYFPCEIYNNYYFNEGLVKGMKILHFKGVVRHYYPFDWKARLYCRTVAFSLFNSKRIINKVIRYIRAVT